MGSSSSSLAEILPPDTAGSSVNFQEGRNAARCFQCMDGNGGGMVAMFGAASRETIRALYIFALVPPRGVEKNEPCFDKAQRVWVQGQAEV